MVCRWEPNRKQEPFAYICSPQGLCTVGPQAWGYRPVSKDSPEHLLTFPSLLASSSPLLCPRKLTNKQEQLVEAARDRPRDMLTASGGTERADTPGHTHEGRMGLETFQGAHIGRARRVEGPNTQVRSLTAHRDGLARAGCSPAAVQLSGLIDCDCLEGCSHHESGGTVMAHSQTG